MNHQHFVLSKRFFLRGMGFYLFAVFLTQFICSGCQMLSGSSKQNCEERKYENSEIDSLRSVIIRLQEEKKTQDDRLNHLENRIITLASKYEDDSRGRTDDIRIEMFQKKFDVIEQKILSHDVIIDYLNKQNVKLDEKLNNTSTFAMELNDEYNYLTQEFEENKRNMKSDMENQQAKLIKTESLLQRRTDTIRNKTEMQMMFFNNTVSRIRLLSEAAQMNISVLSSEFKSKNASEKKLLGMYETMNQVTNELSGQLKTLNRSISKIQDVLYMKHENTQKILKEIDERADTINSSICHLEKRFDKEMIITRQIEEKYSKINDSIMVLEAKIETELNETFHVLYNSTKNIKNIKFSSNKLEKNLSQTTEMILDIKRYVQSLNSAALTFENAMNQTTKEVSRQLKTLNESVSDIEEELYTKDANTQKMIKEMNERANIINNSLCHVKRGFDVEKIKVRDIAEKSNIINGSITVLEAKMNTKLNETFHVLDNLTEYIQNFEFLSDKLGNNLFQTREIVSDTKRDIYSLNLTLVSFENTMSRQNEELEIKLFEFVNATYKNSIDSFLNEIAVLQQRNRNYSSQLSAIFAWEYNLTKNYSSLEQSVSDSRNSIHSLLNRVSSLERSGNSRQSTIDSVQTWVANQKSSYRRLVRLVNGDWSYGRLEVNIDGEGWGNVCDDNFDTTDANVVCRQLGFSRGVARTSAYYGQGSLNIIMDDVDCSGSEQSIHNCRYIGKDQENCNHSEDVGVSCS